MGRRQKRRLFAGKNVVVFSLPGAYTPTCSSTHLPRFNALARPSRPTALTTWCAFRSTMPL
jgi:peroxiredoxin